MAHPKKARARAARNPTRETPSAAGGEELDELARRVIADFNEAEIVEQLVEVDARSPDTDRTPKNAREDRRS